MVSWSVVVRDFSSEKCRCGNYKQEGQYFCRSCYFALPGAYRKRLWIPWARLTQNAICTLYTRCISQLHLTGREVVGVVLLALVALVGELGLVARADPPTRETLIRFEAATRGKRASRARRRPISKRRRAARAFKPGRQSDPVVLDQARAPWRV